jgi:trans-2,3-dihydro-3-hydroxyanthranilate isomerase
VPFAGHPTLGTAYIIQKEILKTHAKEIVLNLKAGQIPVGFGSDEDSSNALWMRQLDPVFGESYSARLLSEILGVNSNEIDERFPIQNVSTGLPTVIVPLKRLESVRKAKIVNSRYLDFTESISAKTILIFCPETYNLRQKRIILVHPPEHGFSVVVAYVLPAFSYKLQCIILGLRQGRLPFAA